MQFQQTDQTEIAEHLVEIGLTEEIIARIEGN